MSRDNELVPKSVKVRAEQNEWLQDNERFNLSGAVREMLDEEMG